MQLAEVMKLIGEDQQRLARLEGQHKVVSMNVALGAKIEDEHVAVVGAVLQGRLLEFVLCCSMKQENPQWMRERLRAQTAKIINRLVQIE